MTFSIESEPFSIEKTNISIEKLNIFIKKLIISIEKTNIFIKKLIISIKKLIISIKKLIISIEKIIFFSVFALLLRAISTIHLETFAFSVRTATQFGREMVLPNPAVWTPLHIQKLLTAWLTIAFNNRPRL